MLTSSAVLRGQPSAAALLGGAAGGRAVRAAAPGGPVVIECSSRPQKKATAHHMKTRPRKTRPWEVNRKPTVYAPLPPLPPDWTLVSDDSAAAAADAAAAQVAETPSAAQAPPTTSPPN